MDAASAVVDPLLSLLQKLETSVNNFFQRKDLVGDNVDQHHRLQGRFANARQLLTNVKPHAACNIIVSSRLEDFENSLGQDVEAFSSLEEQINKAKIGNRVRRMKQILEKFETHLDQFFDFVDTRISPMLETSTHVDDTTTGKHDKYVARNIVPVNPPRLTLDYTTTSTDEGKLRAAILGQGEGRVVALVACGKGGVGKTCALRGLAGDEQIKRRFPGGTLYIQLGNDAAVGDLVEGVAKIVERTGNRKLAEDIRATKTLHEACEKGSDWFYDETCLFLVDDIWMVNGVDCDSLDVLASMVSESSRLVYTTRDKRFLGRAHKVVEFEEKETSGELSRRMLMRHAGFDEGDELEPKSRAAFEAILRECQGLPLAFGIVGGAVLKKCGRKAAGRKQDAWSDFYEDMLSSPHKSKLLESCAEQYGSLTRIVDVSLGAVEMHCEHEEYEKLFRALCVLRKQQQVPLGMLQKLWDLGSLEDTEMIAEVLTDVSLVQMREDDGKVFVQLHDLIVDIAVDKASKKCETQRFFQTLVRNYFLHVQEGGLFSSGEICGDETTIESQYGVQSSYKRVHSQESLRIAWWKSGDDCYLHNNLCRVLRCAGHKDELLWLLSQPRWIVHRLLTAGIYSVERDLEEGRSVLEGNELSDLDHREHLEMIGRAARLSCTFVSDNPREVWFQLHGRLLWHATKSERTGEFVDKIEQCAERPWVQACGVGFLQQASRDVLGIVRSRGEVLCARVEEEEVVFVWYDYEDGMGVIRYNMRTGSRKSTDFVVEAIRVDDKKPRVICATFVRDQNYIVSVDYEGMIVRWSEVTGEIERVAECTIDSVDRETTHSLGWCGMLTGCFGSWECKGGGIDEGNESSFDAAAYQDWNSAAVSADGSCVVSGYLHGKVKAWDAESGEEISEVLCDQVGWVDCVAVSADGSRVVSGSTDDPTLCVWDVESGEGVGEPLLGHTDLVLCAAFSADGSRIVSGSADETLRVWDAESREAVGEPLRGHTSWVRCVAWSEDGSRIASGSDDGSVRVWDTGSGEAVGGPLCGHTDWVLCVAMNADGSRIVSGSKDKTLRVWDAESGKAAAESLRGHTGIVQSVALNADGSRICSGSSDKTVRVWHAESGEALGEPLRGHTDIVKSVALSMDGSRAVSGSLDRTVRVWDAKSGKALSEPLRGHTDNVNCVALSLDGSRAASGSYDTTVRIWDVESVKALCEPFRGHTESVECVALSEDGSRVVSGSQDETVRVWDAESCAAVGEPLRGHTSIVVCVALTADKSRIVSGACDDTVRVWDAERGEAECEPLRADKVRSVVVSAEGSHILWEDSKGLRRLWDTRSGKCVLTSDEASWYSTVRALNLCWSSSEWRLGGLSVQVTAQDEDGNKVVLATCEEPVRNVGGGDRYWPRDLFATCKIVR